MEIKFERWEFRTPSNAMQAFVRIIKQHPQLHLVNAEVETPLYKQEIFGEICADEYNLCVALVGVIEGVYKEEWKSGTTIEFDKQKFDRIPFEYHLDVAARSIVIDDNPDSTELFLMLHSPEIQIRFRIRFLHQIFDDVVTWIASLPADIKPVNHRDYSPWMSVNKAFDRMTEIFDEIKNTGNDK